MSKVAAGKKGKVEAVVEDKAGVLDDVKGYARKIYLVGSCLRQGRCRRRRLLQGAGQGEGVESKGKKLVDEQVEAANSQIESVKQSVNSNVTSVKGKVEVQLDKIEKAFDTRVAAALNRIGIPSKQERKHSLLSWMS